MLVRSLHISRRGLAAIAVLIALCSPALVAPQLSEVRSWEDLLYSERDPDERNTQRSIAESIRRFRPLVNAGKPVFVVEYTTSADLAAAMLREIKELGFIGYVAGRDLNRLSPPTFGCGQPDCSR
jgi:endo-alpha-1,4-polygalactosaminidase (GH114 family)